MKLASQLVLFSSTLFITMAASAQRLAVGQTIYKDVPYRQNYSIKYEIAHMQKAKADDSMGLQKFCVIVMV